MEDNIKALKDRLIKKRTYPVTGKVTWEVMDDMRREMHIMICDNPDQEIFLLVDSSGGDSNAALAGYDFLRGIPTKVIAVVNGFCKSSALELIAGCSRRVATPNSHFYFHSANVHTEISTSVDATLDVYIQEKKHQYEVFIGRYYAAYRNGFGLSKERIQELEKLGDMSRRMYTSAEAKELGVIHEVIKKFPFYSFKTPEK